MNDMQRIRMRIRGRVQGVFYRASARGAAARLGLSGWVANRDDGSVEAVVQGPRETVDRFVDWCREGPPTARVTAVEVEPDESSEPLAGGFDVRF